MKKLLMSLLILVVVMSSLAIFSCKKKLDISTQTSTPASSEPNSQTSPPASSEPNSQTSTPASSEPNSQTSTPASSEPNSQTSPPASSEPNTQPPSQPNIEPFSLTINIPDYELVKTTIKFTVSRETTQFSFINAFSIPSHYEWELHWDKSCLSALKIISKTVDLNEGYNYLYALFFNKNNLNELYLYEIIAYRDFPSTEELQQLAILDAENHEKDILSNCSNDYVTPNYIFGYLLSVKGYSEDICIYACENCNINWQKHAEKYISPYLTYEESFGQRDSWYTANELATFLDEDGFDCQTVSFVLNKIDWDLQLKNYALHLSSFYPTFNRLYAKSLLSEIISDEQGIEYILENSGINWGEHALNMSYELWEECKLQSYYDDKDISVILEDISNELARIWKFKQSEIDYAMNLFSIPN